MTTSSTTTKKELPWAVILPRPIDTRFNEGDNTTNYKGLNKLNSRPRKVLGFQTAIEVTKKELAKMKNVAFVI